MAHTHDLQKTVEAIKKVSAQQFRGEIGRNVFTVSEAYGSNGMEITRLLAERLNLEIYTNEEIISGIAELTKSDKEAVRMIDGGGSDLSDFWIYRLLSGKNFSTRSFRRHLVNVIFSLARLGNCVIVGRGAHLVLADSLALRVRFTISDSVCADRMSRITGEEKATVYRRIRDRRKQRNKFLWDMFRTRLNDPTQFDLMFNTDRLTEKDYPRAVDMLVTMSRLDGEKVSRPSS